MARASKSKPKQNTKRNPKIQENESEHMSWGKCNGCPFLEVGTFLRNKKNWSGPQVFMRCNIYNETIVLTKCIRESEDRYEKEKEHNSNRSERPIGIRPGRELKQESKEEEE